jgi:AraC-like DNA-binding protein
MMRYREVLPPPGLADLILSFWEFAVSEDLSGPVQHHIFPDGCALLSYQGKPARVPPEVRIIGPTLKSRVVTVFPGDKWWGARLQPAAFRAITGLAPGVLRDKAEPCSAVNPELNVALLRWLNGSTSFMEAVLGYGNSLDTISRDQIDRKVAAAVSLIDSSCGKARIETVALAVGLSERQLQRRFNQAVGLTPKQFGRVRRLRTTTVTMLDTRLANWAGLAAQSGYTDQSHLTHELGSLTGHLPSSFERRVRGIEHGYLHR